MKVWLVGVALWCGVLSSFAAGVNRDVSRTPPALYGEKLAPLLTKCGDVLAGRSAFKEDAIGGVVLLNEDIHYRDTDGVLYRVEHRIYHAVNQSAVKNIANDVFTFDHERESIFLIEAATILPDGTRQEVEGGGAFIQTPQHAADKSLYTSSAELTVVYPNLAAGSSVESIVLIRENTPVIAGQFATVRTFGSAWPCYRHRLVVDLPTAEWAKMQLHTTLPGVPDAVTESPSQGRERRTWSKSQISRFPWEEFAPQYSFCTPTLWLTTLSDWDQVATWFDGLVSGRSELGPELEAALGEWTKGVNGREKLIALLQEKVANDVRYTGLEFGLAGYQPNPCREVWGRRYGDCKDKANLLRALLAKKGISSYVALLNAGSGGQVEKASPSWAQFDHAILAVEKEGGGYEFCDPTAKYLPPGVLPPGDLDRDILVVRGTHAEWVRTPDLLNASTIMHADLSMAPDGELSGWFQVSPEGSDAAMYASYYSDFDHDELVRNLQRLVEAFFPGAEVMDTDFKAPAGLVSAFQLRAYFVRPSRAATGNTLRFPFPVDWLPDLDTSGTRHYPYQAKRRKTVFSATIALPPGWTASRLPQAFSAPSETAQVSASWKVEGQTLKAEIAWWPERAQLAASEYGVLKSSIRALKAWFDQPALLSAEEGATATVSTPADSSPLAGFPILPTGEGQLRLLGEKFPEGVKNAERRIALEKILQWFPQDSETVFTAKIFLVQLDEESLGQKNFADKISGVLRTAGAHASPSARAWGQYLEANARWNASKDPGALARLKSMAEDKTLSNYRRGWAAYQAGLFQSEKDGRGALKFLKAYDRLECDAQPSIVGLIGLLYSKAGDAAGLRSWLETIVATSGEDADRLLKAVVGRTESQWASVPPQAQGPVLAALQKTVSNKERFPTAAPAVQKLSDMISFGDIQRGYVRALNEYLQKNPPKWWTREKIARFATADAVIQQIKERNDARDAAGTLDAIAQLLLHHNPDFTQAVLYTRWAMWWLSSREMDEELLALLAAQSLKFPPSVDEEVVECWQTYATHLVAKRKVAEARELFTRIYETKEARDYQRVEAAGELAKLELSVGRVNEALAAFAKVEPIHTTHRRGVDYLYIATLVRLERGEFNRAVELLTSIKKQDTKWIEKANHAVALTQLLKQFENPDKLKDYWQHAAKWRPIWNRILIENGLSVSTEAQPPIDDDFNAIAERVDHAISARDAKEFVAAIDTYVRLAQWIPIFVNDSATAINRSATLSAPLWRSLVQCLLPMVKDAPPVNPEFVAATRMWEAAALADLGKRKEAAALARQLYSNSGDNPRIAQAALRIWAMSARGGEGEGEALNAIKTLLESDREVFSRAETVAVYSDGLFARNERDENVKLLQRELARSEVSANSALVKTLSARLKLLTEQNSGAASLTRDVNLWLEKEQITWLKALRPTSLDNPRFAGRKEAITPWQHEFSPGETFKFDLLLALDEGQTRAVRESAFQNAVYVFADLRPTAQAFARAIMDGISCESLSTETRGAMAHYGTLMAFRMGATQCGEEIYAKLIAIQPTTDRDWLERDRRIATLVEKRKEGWAEESFKIIVGNPVDFLESQLGARILTALVLTGHADDADRLLASAEGITPHPSFKLSASNIRLDWMRRVRAAKTLAPFLTGVREILLKLPEAKLPRPPLAERQLSGMSVGNRTDEECFTYCLNELEAAAVGPEGLVPWSAALHESSVMHGKNGHAALEILALALKTPADDSAKSVWVRLAAAHCDYDIPEIREEAGKLFKQFTDSPEAREYPATLQAIAHYFASMALRTSTEPRPAALFADAAKMNSSDAEVAAMQLVFHYTRGNDAECLACLDRLDADRMSEPNVFGFAKNVLRQANRTDELKLLEGSVREKLAQRQGLTWLAPENSFAVHQVINLLDSLGDSSALPDGWFDYVLQHRRGLRTSLWIECMRARLTGDWPELLRVSDELLKAESERFDIYYERALAEYHLKQSEAEKRDLEIFLSHARTSEHYREAQKMLNELSGKPQEVVTGSVK